jgi:hypothetical protein
MLAKTSAAKPDNFFGRGKHAQANRQNLDFRLALLDVRIAPCRGIDRPTSEMSHDDSRRGACSRTISNRRDHSANREKARAVTDVGVGSGVLFGGIVRKHAQLPSTALLKPFKCSRPETTLE